MKHLNNTNTYLHKKFYTNIRILKLSKICVSATVSVSGGQDSLSLIKLLHDLKKYDKVFQTTQYVYIDHQWRQDSKNQIKHLVNFIQNQNIEEKVYVYQINNTITSETQARRVRYQILLNHSIYYKNSIIITAHTETDKIETFLYQIMRGASIDGATNLSIHRILEHNIQLFRPLINFTRAEISWFCRKYYLPIWSDSTNYLYHINRNRVRNELIPYLQKYFQQNIDKQINKFLDASNMDNDYIKQNSIKLYLLSRHIKNIAINYSFIKTQHKSLQIRTLQIFFYHNLSQNLNRKIIYKIINKLNNSSRIDKDVIEYNSIKIRIHNHWIYIY